MAIPKGRRFAIEFDNTFSQGLVQVGEIALDNEYQRGEGRAVGRPVRQRIEPNAKRASFKATDAAGGSSPAVTSSGTTDNGEPTGNAA